MRHTKFLLPIVLFLLSISHYTQAQTIIFSDPGASYNNTDAVTTDTYGPVNVQNCTSISFSVDYMFSLPFGGPGNMESSDECPFGIPPCQGDPNDPQGGGCFQCWDFFYVQFQLDGGTVHTELVGVPGSINQSGTITYGPICTNGAVDASMIVQTQTWAADESITFSNITITCWDASSTLSANPDPVCAGQSFNLDATLTDPPSVNNTMWSGPGTIVSPNNLSTQVNGAPVGTNTYTLTATDDNNCTATNTIDVTLNPGPTMDPVANITVCANDQVDVSFTGSGNLQFDWTNSNTAIGLGANGSGDLSFTAANVVNPVTGTITVTPSENGCIGPNQVFTITVNPAPSVNQPNNVTVCGGLPVVVNFTGSPGTVFDWTNDNTNIGLGVNGAGNINFTSLNPANQEIANITVTPMINGCFGQPVNFTITVNPTPSVTDPPNQSVCAGDQVDVTFTGSGNAQFTWTNSNPGIGLPTNGTGDISFTAASVLVPTTGNLNVTPSENGCQGTNQNFTITVNPLPSVNQPNDVEVCGGELIVQVFSGTPGASFSWINDNPNIGLGSSGNGGLNFVASTVPSQEIANITVTPILNGCEGSPLSFTITVNPSPIVNNPGNLTFCSGELVDVIFTGFVNPTYSWTNSNTAIGLAGSGNGDINFTASNVVVPTTGTISVTPSENGCMGATETFNITISPAPTMNATKDTTVCAGTLLNIPFTGSAGATFSWTNSDTLIGLGLSGNGNINFMVDQVSAVDTGIIVVQPVIGSCQGATDTFLIIVNPAPGAVTPADTSVCSGTNLMLTFSGSVNPVFNWFNNNTGIGLGNSGMGDIGFVADSTGTGTITVIPEENGCLGDTVMFDITVLDLPVVDQPVDASACAGDVVSVNFTGSAGATFSWTNDNTAIGLGASGNGNISFTSASVGTAAIGTISVTPSLTGCVGTPLDFDITINPLPGINLGSIVCAPDLLTYEIQLTTIGDVVTSTDGTVSGSNGNFTISGIPAGTDVTISSTVTSTGCQSQAAVNAPDCSCAPVNTPNMPNNPTICEGDPIPALIVSTVPGNTIDWYDSATGGILLQAGSTTYTPAGPLLPGVYTFFAEARDTTTDCTSSTRQPVNLVVSAQPTVTAPANQTVCAGNMISLNFAGTNGATFNWTNDNPGIGLSASGNGNISFTGINAGNNPLLANLTVTPVLNGCTGAAQNFTITINPVPTITLVSTTCSSDLMTYSVTVNSNGNNLTSNAGGVTGNGSSFNIMNIPVGTDAVLIATLNATGCMAQLTVPSPICNCPTVMPPNGPNFPVICEGATIPALMVTVGPGETVDWYTVPTGGTPVFTGSSSYTPPGPFTPGTYIFYAETRESSTNCVSASRTPVFLTVNAAPNMTQPLNQTVCAGFIVSVGFNGTSGSTYNWTNSNPSIGLAANGTGNISFSTVNPGTAPVVATITVTPTLMGCNGQPKSFTVTVNPKPVLTDPADVTVCVGGPVAVNFTVLPTATINWTNNNTGIGLTGNGMGNINFNTTAPGMATVTATPIANGCTGSAQSFNINVLTLPVVNPPADVTVCALENISVGFTGDPGVTYSWTNDNTNIGLPANGNGNLNFSAPNVGGVQTAQITVTPQVGLCVGASATFSITINPLPIAVIAGITTICNGDVTTLTASGGTGFNWSSGENTAAIMVSPSTTTQYTATVTELGCSSTTSATVTVNQPTSATVNQLTCDTAEVGTVVTVITNAAGCDSTITTITTLDIPGCTPAPQLLDGSVSCFGASDGVLTLSATGGLAPYDYAWSNGTQSGNGQIAGAGAQVQLQNLTAGTYTVTITGSNGLTSTQSAVISSPTMVQAQANAEIIFGNFPLSCAGAADAVIDATAMGGTPQYTYNWSVPGQTGATLSGVGAGTYGLTVTDANMCTTTTSVSIQDPPPLSFGVSLAAVDCGESTVTAQLSPTNGVNPFTVTVDGTPAPGGLMPSMTDGDHLIEISDANGCMADTMVLVELPPVPSISLPAEATVVLGEPLILQAQTNLDIWQSLVWTPLPDSTCPNCLKQEWIPEISGVYEVAITDTFGCSAIASVRVLVTKQEDIYIPNVFSPNLDGVNDFWQVYGGVSVRDLNALRIFDRWGSLVYELASPVPVNEWPGWDGTYRGDILNPAVFVYYMEITLASGEVVFKSGDLTLLR
ncbi:MAG: PKD-like domain-containing protein [Saprospiraceae bacterium]